MKIVLLESLGVSEDTLMNYAQPLIDGGHTFCAYERDPSPAIQIKRARDADIVIIANMPLAAEVIGACERLKLIDVAFTGVDHVDLKAAEKKGVRVCNAAGYSTQAVAELAVCMMLSLLRNVSAAQQRCRGGKTKDGLVGSELCGKTVGIVGMGAIGRRTAALCSAFGCKVLGYRRHVRGDEPGFVEMVALDELLNRSDIVSLHCPLNEESRGLIGRDSIAKMKRGAYLINVARGPVADSEALAQALDAGRLAGAGIDVFESEPPLDPAHPLLRCRNTLVTPHVAFASHESMNARAAIVFENIRLWMEGNPANVIL